jgi:hypothetical protein
MAGGYVKLLICGDRNWSDGNAVREVIAKFQPAFVIEGEARGADILARLSAEAMGIEVKRFPADWEKYGRAAGPIRNSQMLKEGRPDVVVGFHYKIDESKGTRDMLTRAKKAGKATFIFDGKLKEF